MAYGIIEKPLVRLTNEAGTEVTDELLSGWAVEVLGEEYGRVQVTTHYGYTGFLQSGEVAPLDGDALRQRDGVTYTVKAAFADVLAGAKVQTKRLETLYRGSLVTRTGSPEGGFVPVRTAAGNDGLVPETALMKRRDSDGFLLAEEKDGYFLRQTIPGPENTFRTAVADTARLYLNTPYRWGGKTPEGIDCSGLVFMAYLLNGVCLHRDSGFDERYPVHRISEDELKKGDLMYFPGHIALYLGNGEYIHSSAYRFSYGCAVNSLNPKSPLYRADLVKLLRHGGSVFAPQEAKPAASMPRFSF